MNGKTNLDIKHWVIYYFCLIMSKKNNHIRMVMNMSIDNELEPVHNDRQAVPIQ